MPTFMDFHDDLQLPAEAISQIREDTKEESATSLVSARWSCSTTKTGKCTACSKGLTRRLCVDITRPWVSPVAKSTM